MGSEQLHIGIRQPLTRSRRSRGSLIRLPNRSEEHTSELQSHLNLVCRLLLEKKNNIKNRAIEQPRMTPVEISDTELYCLLYDDAMMLRSLRHCFNSSGFPLLQFYKHVHLFPY